MDPPLEASLEPPLPPFPEVPDFDGIALPNAATFHEDNDLFGMLPPTPQPSHNSFHGDVIPPPAAMVEGRRRNPPRAVRIVTTGFYREAESGEESVESRRRFEVRSRTTRGAVGAGVGHGGVHGLVVRVPVLPSAPV